MTARLGAAALLAIHLGRLKDRHGLTPAQVSLGKLNNVRAALGTVRQCGTLLGASGITLEYPVLRHASNLESVLIYEGTEEVHQLNSGRQAVTGYLAFRLATTPEGTALLWQSGRCRLSPATAPPICSSYDRQGILGGRTLTCGGADGSR